MTQGAAQGAGAGTGSYALEGLLNVVADVGKESAKKKASGGAGVAGRLFGAGAASLATGNPLPIVSQVLTEVIAFHGRARPQTACTVTWPKSQQLSEHLRPEPEVVKFFGKGTARVHNSREIQTLPDLSACDGVPGEPCLYSFEELVGKWQQIARTTEPQHQSTGDGEATSKRKNTVNWAHRWLKLSPKQQWELYKVRVLPCITAIDWKQLTTEQIIALEELWGGRVIDGVWYWLDERYEGRPVEEWPRWIPDEGALHSIYRDAWFEYGLSDKDLQEVATSFSPTQGMKGALSQMPKPNRRQALANTLVLAAAAAEADNQAFAEAERRIAAMQDALGLTGKEALSYSDVLKSLERYSEALAMKRTGQSPGGSSGPDTQTWLAIGGAAVVTGLAAGAYLFAKRRRRR